MDATKVSIKVGAVSLDLEGAETFVAEQLEKLSFLLTRPPETAEAEASPEADAPANELEEPAPSKGKRASRIGGSGGQGCSVRVTSLLDNGFFKNTKTTGEVVAKLKEQATPYPANKVSAALIGSVKRRKLRRYQEGGKWLFIEP